MVWTEHLDPAKQRTKFQTYVSHRQHVLEMLLSTRHPMESPFLLGSWKIQSQSFKEWACRILTTTQVVICHPVDSTHTSGSVEGKSNKQQEHDSRTNPKLRSLLLFPSYTSTGFVKTKPLLQMRKHCNPLSHQLLIQNKPEEHMVEADEFYSCMLQWSFLLYTVRAFASPMPAFNPKK